MKIEERIREVVDAHVQSLTSDLVRVVAEQDAQWRMELDRVVAEAQEAREAREAAEHEARVRQEEHARLREENESRLREETAAAQAVMGATHSRREIRVETLERLLGAVRRIDESNSLTGILGALIHGAAAETSRVAILLVDGYMFRTWDHQGFEEGTSPTEMPIGGSGTLAAAVALRQSSFVPPMIEGRESTVPEFMRVPAGHTGLVVPLAIGGEVVAVLYADDMFRSVEQEDAPLWTEEVELLARHAALRLENVTSVRTVEVLTGTD